ncbi:sulfatase family protein [Thalassoroseus pseudoceratinae]|uniref:sulfatase family protein n=1 Tax=Thalassoroseus pseudoceratinae TaxID=2713176 RepID=UPI0014232CD2|nr:sulfatase [Thalassoroseus pseudoceratinae]
MHALGSLVSTLLVVCWSTFAFAADTKSSPNFVIVLADDMTYTDLGCFGNSDVHTPNLDRLASEGMKLTRCFSPAPMCAPTRSALYTGLFPVRNGAHPNHSRVRDGVRSLPHFLKPLGYRVALAGKRHIKPMKSFPFEYLGKGKQLDFPAIREFVKRDSSQPFCLVVTSNHPHEPWSNGDPAQYDADELTVPPYLVDTPATRDALTKYYAEITAFDQQVKRVLNILEQTGNTKSTLVSVFTEQGSSFPHCKWTCYDTGLQAAGIVRWPGVVKPNSESSALVQYVDIPPTLIAAAGGDPSEFDFDGTNFLPVLKGDRSTHREYVYGVQTSKGIIAGPDAYGIRSVRDTRYKLIWNINHDNKFQNIITDRHPVFQEWKRQADDDNQFALERVSNYQKRPEFEFYDLETDPFELKNLADASEYQAEKERLHRQLDQWMKQQGDTGNETELDALNRQGRKK